MTARRDAQTAARRVHPRTRPAAPLPMHRTVSILRVRRNPLSIRASTEDTGVLRGRQASPARRGRRTNAGAWRTARALCSAASCRHMPSSGNSRARACHFPVGPTTLPPRRQERQGRPGVCTRRTRSAGAHAAQAPALRVRRVSACAARRQGSPWRRQTWKVTSNRHVSGTGNRILTTPGQEPRAAKDVAVGSVFLPAFPTFTRLASFLAFLASWRWKPFQEPRAGSSLR
jgi:hypothetical protein